MLYYTGTTTSTSDVTDCSSHENDNDEAFYENSVATVGNNVATEESMLKCMCVCKLVCICMHVSCAYVCVRVSIVHVCVRMSTD